MSKKIKFALGIHNHQPVGNFDSVIEKAFTKAYIPFLDLLEKYPQIKLNLHFTGPLWDFIIEKKGFLIEKINQLILKGQIELLTGAYYEPILPAILDHDKIGQINKQTQEIQRQFNYTPKGMWLAERVWEPSLAKPISMAGVKYILLDESHFYCAGVNPDQLFGYYLTEEFGHKLAIFPISERLRYLIPFAEHRRTFDHLWQWATPDGERIAIMADDGEKFGVWPKTFETVYTNGWLERFFQLITENSDWIEMTTFSEYLEAHKPLGRIYLPAASYSEMMQWSLPTKIRRQFETIKSDISDRGELEKLAPYLRAGFWRNFFVKYPESNDMHKKSIILSEEIEKMTSPLKEEAQVELWKGQCNCPYWHGVFGGIYMGHLRDAIYKHLINAQKILDKYKYGDIPFHSMMVCDFNKDDSDEIILDNNTYTLGLSPHYGGSIFELSYKPASFNIINTITRKEESYHEQVLYIAQIEDQLENLTEGEREKFPKFKEKGLEKYLNYDWYQKISLIDHILHPVTALPDFLNCAYGEQGSFVDQDWQFKEEIGEEKITIKLKRQGGHWKDERFLPLFIKKDISITKNSDIIDIYYEIRNISNEYTELSYGNEWNIRVVTLDSPHCFFEVNNGYKTKWALKHEGFKDYSGNRAGFGTTGEITGIKDLSVIDSITQIKTIFRFEEEFDLWHGPIWTVTNSEEGFEKGFQQVTLLFRNKICLKPDETKTFKFNLTVKKYEY